MGRLAEYLQEHVMGEVLDGADVLSHFSKDASVLNISPEVVVYPKNEQDVRKVVRFSWQLAEKGRHIGITSRGAGTDLGGASIGDGVILAFSAHMNKVVTLDSKTNTINTEPGATLGKINQAFNVQYRTIPSVPGSSEYATVGGAVANNSGGAYSLKYGPIGNYVSELRVVLANGEVIRVNKLSRRELNRKLGLANFEGQIYRQLDAILSEKEDLVKSLADNSPGYSLKKIRGKSNSFDLTPLFVGAQGTLGIITEVGFESEEYTPLPSTLLAQFNTLDELISAVREVKKLKPAALEMVDGKALRQVAKIAPTAFRPVFKKLPEFALLVEFDDSSARTLKKNAKAAAKIFANMGVHHELAKDQDTRDKFWKVRNSIGHILSDSSSKGRNVPGIEDAAVPLGKYKQLYDGAVELFAKYRLPFVSWGRIGMGQLSLMPKIDLGEVSGRQRIYKLMDEYNQLVVSLGGKISLHHNDGRSKGQYQRFILGQEGYELMVAIKDILDPYNILNPGVKIDVDRNKTLAATRTSYSMSFYTHLPRL